MAKHALNALEENSSCTMEVPHAMSVRQKHFRRILGQHIAHNAVQTRIHCKGVQQLHRAPVMLATVR